jgi:flagellar basal-body rod protein FlgB
MIDALFNQPDYLAAKKQLDAIALRQDAIASNIANLETPGYKRLDVAPAFNSELQRACAARDPQQIASLNPQLAVDPNAAAVSPDGNTVNLESEMLEMNKNSLASTLQTQLITTDFYRLRMAITGKSS